MKKLSINNKLSLFALILGFVAIFIADPTTNKMVTINAEEISRTISDNSVKISVVELADKIIEGRLNFVLIDLSNEKKYAEYNIPSSINMKPQDIKPGNITRNEKIILYADDDYSASQTWFLLKANKYKNVFLLEGGMKEWKDKILFPKIPDSISTAEINKYEKLKKVSVFFGGQPLMAGGQASGMRMEMKINKPAMSGGAVLPAGKGKPKKEGC